MHQDAVGLHRLHRVIDARQFLVFHVDQVDGLARDVLVDGGHRSDRFACVANLAAGEKRLILDRRAEFLIRQVVRGDGRAYARECAGTTDVDGNDARVGVRRPQRLAVQHARQGEVGAIDQFARNLVDQVAAPGRLADVLQRLAGLLPGFEAIHGSVSCSRITDCRERPPANAVPRSPVRLPCAADRSAPPAIPQGPGAGRGAVPGSPRRCPVSRTGCRK